MQLRFGLTSQPKFGEIARDTHGRAIFSKTDKTILAKLDLPYISAVPEHSLKARQLHDDSDYTVQGTYQRDWRKREWLLFKPNKSSTDHPLIGGDLTRETLMRVRLDATRPDQVQFVKGLQLRDSLSRAKRVTIQTELSKDILELKNMFCAMEGKHMESIRSEYLYDHEKTTILSAVQKRPYQELDLENGEGARESDRISLKDRKLYFYLGPHVIVVNADTGRIETAERIRGRRKEPVNKTKAGTMIRDLFQRYRHTSKFQMGQLERGRSSVAIPEPEELILPEEDESILLMDAAEEPVHRPTSPPPQQRLVVLPPTPSPSPTRREPVPAEASAAPAPTHRAEPKPQRQRSLLEIKGVPTLAERQRISKYTDWLLDGNIPLNGAAPDAVMPEWKHSVNSLTRIVVTYTTFYEMEPEVWEHALPILHFLQNHPPSRRLPRSILLHAQALGQFGVAQQLKSASGPQEDDKAG